MKCKVFSAIRRCAVSLTITLLFFLTFTIFSTDPRSALCRTLDFLSLKQVFQVQTGLHDEPQHRKERIERDVYKKERIEGAVYKKERKNRFVYIKIEKTGSSTLSNIFSAYGYRHRLNMLMSTIKQSLINTRELEPGNSWNIGPDPSNPHISEQHARYNPEFFSRFFPNDTVYITSIRHPVKWFISYVDFMGAYRKHNPRSVLHHKALFEKTRDEILGLQKHVHNNFLQFLGFDVYKSWDRTAIRDYIDFINHRFSLVMLTDYFDESLVLLKRMMSWTLVDIFYSYANEARHKSDTVFTEHEISKLIDEDHNYGDWLLYQYANQSFWRRIHSQPDFFDELHQFKVLKIQVQEFCYSKELKHNKSLTLELSTVWDGLMTIRDEDCLASRIVKGKAPELSKILDKYVPFRRSKTRSHVLND